MEECSKFAKQLLLKFRINLSSDNCLKHLLNDSSCISMKGECVKVFNRRRSLYQKNYIIPDKARYCNKSMFNIMICGGYYKK